MSDVDSKDGETSSISQGSRGGETLAEIFWPNTEVRDAEADDAHVFTAKKVESHSHQDVSLLSMLVSAGYH